MNVYLTPVGYALGDLRETALEASQRGTLCSSPGVLTDAGFCTHYIASTKVDVYDLAREATQNLAHEVDVIIFATALPESSAGNSTERFRETGDVRYLMDYPASRLQVELDSQAAVIGLGQQACTSALGAIRIARSLILAGECCNVLCVTADRFPAGAKYEQAYNFISDGSAACLVGLNPGPFRFLGSAHITEGSLALASDDATVGSYFSHTAAVVNRACEKSGPPHWLVTQNTHVNANRVLGSLLGVADEQIWCPTRAEMGHVISADNLINLEMFASSPMCRTGEVIALPMAGYGANWQCIVLEAA